MWFCRTYGCGVFGNLLTFFADAYAKAPQSTQASSMASTLQTGSKLVLPKTENCPPNQKRFFGNVKLYVGIAKTSQTDPNFIMALSAQESGWNGKHSQQLHNLFGLTHAGGNNLGFPSYQASADYWASHFASWVQGTKTVNSFLDGLLNHNPPYNSADPNYRVDIAGGTRNDGTTTPGTYNSVLHFKQSCGVQIP